MTAWNKERNQIQARILLDSISPSGDRLTTMEVTFWRMMLAEANTHRVWSRNSESSRAVPFDKKLQRVLTDPYIPFWGLEQSGMQSDHDDAERLSEVVGKAEAEWLRARDDSVMHAQSLADLGIHKSIVNRLLEPWMYHTVIVSATEWDGFFIQRCSPLAQKDIQVPAEMMRDLYESSEPTPLDYGDWHTPLIQPEEDDEFWAKLAGDRGFWVEAGGTAREKRDNLHLCGTDLRKKVSAARCARVSYLTHTGVRDIDKDLELFNRLKDAKPWPHASPFEHVATPCQNHGRTKYGDRSGQAYFWPDGTKHLGNFRGWDQYRHQLLGL